MANILYISHSGSLIGGGESQLYHLVRNLDASRYRPIVVCPDDGVFVEKLRSEEIPTYVLSLPAWRKVRTIPFRRSAVKRLIRLVESNDIRIIHTSDLWMNYYVWKVSQRTGVRTVSHVRNLLDAKRAHKYLFNKIDRIISISNQLKQPLVQAGIPIEKIHTIYNGVDLSEFTLDIPKVNVLRRDFEPLSDLLVGIVGRIEPFKGQSEFLQASVEVLKVRQDVTFFLIGASHAELGQGAYLEEIQHFIHEHDIAQYIVFTGFRTDMPEVMASLDILVSASAGTVMIEAMAAGIPVVATNIASASEVIADGVTGILVPHSDIHAMAEAILRLLDDPNMRRQMGQAGRKRAEEQFSQARNVQLTQAVYDNLLHRNQVF
ncbi:glycosyltransferase family 4 protein [Candidatus Poribacteria bacterium]|nr:glycosyltransferase family 4 protein [Candidatus Poribacteria bacterium]